MFIGPYSTVVKKQIEILGKSLWKDMKIKLVFFPFESTLTLNQTLYRTAVFYFLLFTCLACKARNVAKIVLSLAQDILLHSFFQ